MAEEYGAEEYLLHVPQWSKEKNRFPAVTEFLEHLGNPQEEFQIIHVAGTNGKGSVCAYLTSVLCGAGIPVGTFTSPHLESIRERIAVNGEMISAQAFEDSFQSVLAAVREEERMGNGFHHPAFFEFLFYMALAAFRDARVRYVVLETGLGGRLDVTNVIPNPVLTVITSIGLDHTRYLGDTIEAIAGEKAGIIKRQVPVIYDSSRQDAAAVIAAAAGRLDAPAYPVSREDTAIVREDSSGFTVELKLPDGEKQAYEVPFPAPYQAVNAGLAVRGLMLLPGLSLTQRQIRDGIRKTGWPGRMEQIRPGIYLDGAHNPAAFQGLVESILRLRRGRRGRLYLLFAAAEDKDYKGMAGAACEMLHPDEIGIAALAQERTADPGAMGAVFRELTDRPVHEFDRVDMGLAFMMEKKGQEDLLVCAGSLYLVGEVKQALRRNSHD